MILVVIGTACASVGVLVLLGAVGQPGWSAVIGIVGAAVIGFLTAMAFRLIRAPNAVLGLFPLIPLGNKLVTVVFQLEPGHSGLWPDILGALIILPGLAGAMAYCKLTGNWDSFSLNPPSPRDAQDAVNGAR